MSRAVYLQLVGLDGRGQSGSGVELEALGQAGESTEDEGHAAERIKLAV